MSTRTLLILGGTQEAYQLAEALAAEPIPRLGTVLTSLSGATAKPRLPAGALRVGGFGGVAGLAAFFREASVHQVVDATHPFAAQMSTQAVQACELTKVPLVRLARPAWVPEPDDHWIMLPNLEAAHDWLQEHPGRVFLTVGERGWEVFRSLDGARFWVRTLQAPAPDAWPGASWVQQRGPFSVEAEQAWMEAQSISVLVSKNSGGTATQAKLEAARARSTPVLMIERPVLPEAPTVETVEEALLWLRRS